MRHEEDNDDLNVEGMYPLSDYEVALSFRVSGKEYGKRDVLLTVFKSSEVKQLGYADYSYLYRYRTANVGSRTHFTSEEYDDYDLCVQLALLKIYRSFYENKQEHDPST
jgi:hypothetical protein